MKVKIIECPDCGKKNVAKAAVCIQCGNVLNEKTYQKRFKQPSNSSVDNKLIFTVLAVLTIAAIMFYPDDESRNEALSKHIAQRNKDFEARKELSQSPLTDREKKIQKQFSSWSGEHRELAKRIKLNLPSPDSYEHKKTVMRDLNNHILVTTTFTATNVFGARIQHVANAVISVEGDIKEFSID